MELAGLLAWLARKLNGSEAADYVTISPQEGRSGRRPAYVQRAKVRVNDRPAAAVCDAVAEELHEINRSRAAESDPLRRVKVYVYGPKGAELIGEHVFMVGEAGDEEEDERGGKSEASALVAAMHEMRLGMADSNGHLVRVTSGAMMLAQASMEKANGLQSELAEARGALMIAEEGKYDAMRELIEGVKPVLPQIIQMFAAKMGGM